MTGRLVKLALLLGVAALALGLWLGSTRLPLGAAPMRTVEATAKLENAETGLGLADAEDGDLQFAFNVPAIAWSSESGSGEGNPPCLREPGRKAKVEIGYRSLRLPDGGEIRDVALWLRCL